MCLVSYQFYLIKQEYKTVCLIIWIQNHVSTNVSAKAWHCTFGPCDIPGCAFRFHAWIDVEIHLLDVIVIFFGICLIQRKVDFFYFQVYFVLTASSITRTPGWQCFIIHPLCNHSNRVWMPASLIMVQRTQSDMQTKSRILRVPNML